MEHNHSEHHHHPEITNINKAFVIGIVLNSLFVITEVSIGYFQSSLALISDALHNLTDVFSLLFSLFAFKMMKVKATENYSYGYKKVSILASLFNAVFLIITTIIIFYEGFSRISHPYVIDGQTISLVAFAGIFVNGISAFLFFKDREKDLNIKGAYLHLLGDTLVSFGVVVGGIIIYFTHWFWLDTMLSFVIGIVILIATWNLLNDSIRSALDGTPRSVDLQKVKETIQSFSEIADVHHIHIWAISSNQNAMTAHIVLKENDVSKFEKVKHKVKHELEHLNIHHTTFELETENCEENC
jgi:cobalt-zinc-cadmium efflux system protein